MGDSRAYLFREGGLTQVTRDQSLVEKLIEDKIIKPEDAAGMGVSNIILQALGSEEDLEVAHPEQHLRAGDLLLLCTDGLTGVVADAEVEQILGGGGSLEELCGRLVEKAEANGGPDNITVLLGSVAAEPGSRRVASPISCVTGSVTMASGRSSSGSDRRGQTDG